MTDNDIIKALELEAIYCRGEGNMYGSTKKTFVDAELIEGALALINRQKAEISVKNKLLNIAEAKFKAYEMDKAQLESDLANERMNLEHLQYEFDLLEQEKSVVIAEAVKEFAERLKQKKTTAISCNRFEGVVSTDDIDNLVKEFTEGGNDG